MPEKALEVSKRVYGAGTKRGNEEGEASLLGPGLPVLDLEDGRPGVDDWRPFCEQPLRWSDWTWIGCYGLSWWGSWDRALMDCYPCLIA